jgi:hypothetical protein
MIENWRQRKYIEIKGDPDSKIQRQKDIDRYGRRRTRPISNLCHLPDPHCFTLQTKGTFDVQLPAAVPHIVIIRQIDVKDQLALLWTEVGDYRVTYDIDLYP